MLRTHWRLSRNRTVLVVGCLVPVFFLAMVGIGDKILGPLQNPQRISQVFYATPQVAATGLMPICGNPDLPVISIAATDLPGLAKTGPVVAPAADTIGQIRKFSAYDWNKSSYHTVTSKLVRKGSHGVIYIDTTLVAETEPLDRLRQDFDTIIYPRDTAIFGAEPRPGTAKDVDGDSLITILLYDIRDDNYYNQNVQSFIAGYFSPNNEVRKSQFANSNEREMVYVDSRSLSSSPNLTLGTLAHEFQHLIQYNQDNHEATWVNEGLSEYAITACGYDRGQPFYFFQNPDRTLTTFNNEVADYDKVYMFFLYLHEHYGGDAVIRAISTNTSVSINGVETGLKTITPAANFKTIFSDWTIANYLDYDDGGQALFGYRTLNLQAITVAAAYSGLPVANTTGSLQAYAADYLEFKGGENLVIHFDGADNNPNYRARVVKFSTSAGKPVVEEIALDSGRAGALSIAGFGADVVKATLIISHNHDSPVISSYEFSADGTPKATVAEIGYDDGTPVYVWPGFAKGDTIVTAFDAQGGMVLDSVRIKFYTTGQAEFHVWQNRGNGLPGKDLTTPIQQSVTKIASKSNPDPWENIDFTGASIDLAKSFCLGFVLLDAAPDPQIISDSLESDPLRSFVYTSGGSGTGWYFVPADFMVRAFVSSLINDFTTPQVSLGVLQNPVFTENLDVYIYSPKGLNPNSVAATLDEAGTSSDLTFQTSSSENTLFKNSSVSLTKSGKTTIIARATHSRGVIVGVDTVSFTSQLVGAAAKTIVSADGKLELAVPAQAVHENVWLTMLPARNTPTGAGNAETPVAVSGYEQITPAQNIGPAKLTFARPATLHWRYTGDDARQIFIGRMHDNAWEILPTRLDDGGKTLSAVVGSTGTYALFRASDGLQNTSTNIPQTFALDQNYPNPFNPETTIVFALPTSGKVTIAIYNLTGERVRALINSDLGAGWHRIVWNGRDDSDQQVASGVYFYRLQAGDFAQVRKMTLLR